MKTVVILFIIFYTNLFSQISLTGGPYSQNFDSYQGSVITLPIGWQITFELSSIYKGIGSGTSNVGGAWAYGVVDEYSLGALRSGTPGNLTFIVNFINNTGETIADMTIEWDYEQWRFANTSGFDVSGTGILAGNSYVDNEDFTGTSSGTNGTVANTHVSINLTGINVLDGQSFGLEWLTTDPTGSDNGIAIDDFQISGPSPLLVELSSFTASIVKNNVKLNWRTETEVNNYGFDVERSSFSLGKSWEVLGFIEGNGNSNSPREYSFIDQNVLAGKYSYRLKQIDNDGTFTYSKIIKIDFNASLYYELGQNYPNPFNSNTTIKYSIPEEGVVKVSLFNILGEEVKILFNQNSEAGIHTINFNSEDLNSGIYFYKIEINNFVEVKKMCLLK